ncbi:MAG: hypothetical protein NVSMB45_19300 [Ginsengibacter sp.]
MVKMEAAIWIVGPSLPMVPPPNAIIKLDSILMTIILRLKSLFTNDLFLGLDNSTAAITWGIPLPLASGEKYLTSHHEDMKHTGTKIKINGK